jgi:hypothetical protein
MQKSNPHMVFNLNSPLKLSLTNSHLNLDMQTGLQDSFWHMTLGYQVLRLLVLNDMMQLDLLLQFCLTIRYFSLHFTFPYIIPLDPWT